jgi:NAD(P)-dependent dehydrogenase (short-subunit alcohol dehydrogenase family)
MAVGNMVADELEADFLAKMQTYSALGRLASPDDIARAVLFLADPANTAITGTFLPVDGGTLPGA